MWDSKRPTPDPFPREGRLDRFTNSNITITKTKKV
jgi:hypothetical protein